MVRFRSGTFRALRPGILPYLVDIGVCPWGWWIEFHGSAAELVAAGLGPAELFEIGRSGERTTRGEFGDKYIVKRVRGKWTLTMYVREIAEIESWPSGTWLKNGGAEAEAATADIVKRFAPTVRP
jgi:hypothetical protein